MPDPYKTSKKSVFWTFVFGIFGFTLFGLAVLLMSHFKGETETLDQQRGAERLAKLHELQAVATRTLTEYAWADKAKGEVRIPIARAMELVLPELQAHKPEATSIKAPPRGDLPPAAPAAPTAP